MESEIDDNTFFIIRIMKASGETERQQKKPRNLNFTLLPPFDLKATLCCLC